MVSLHRLPNLPALRAFEASARHENFSLAAKELHVTSSAVSHQVRLLEEELGVPLFARHGKRIAITQEGQKFAVTLRKLLVEIARAADALRASKQQNRLSISAIPSFAGRWLSPRLGQFIDQYPDIEVTLQASKHLVDFATEAVDIGVRVGQGNYPGLWSEVLMDDYYYPVVSPHFNGGHLPRSPQDLMKSKLLRSESEPWLPWFRAAQLDCSEPSSRLVFQDDASMLVRAAVEGHGVALARHVLVTPEIASGKLVRLFDIAVKCPFSYYLVCLPSTLQKTQVQTFREWITAEVKVLRTEPPCRILDYMSDDAE